LFWDTANPYHYTRTWKAADGDDQLIVGGEDRAFDVSVNSDEPFKRLEQYARGHFGISTVSHRWSGRVFDTRDGLPIIGASALDARVFIATGYCGNGLTFGTLAATMLADAALGRQGRYQALFDPRRPSLREADSNARDAGPGLADILPGSGVVMALKGRRYAAYRDASGSLSLLSPECPHLYCEVVWNADEKVWDCPCHGSRFAPDGRVMRGPATESLMPLTLP
jgi:nitrite reductase/ring-hydroxylating ferredoxin subunit